VVGEEKDGMSDLKVRRFDWNTGQESPTGEHVMYKVYSELEQHRDQLKASVINMLAVFDSLDVYNRYEAVRRDAREALMASRGKSA
jgi:hypothetical protein